MRAVALLLSLALPAHAEVAFSTTAETGVAHRVGSGPGSRLLFQQALTFDLDGWLVGARAGQVTGAGSFVLRVGGEFGYRFAFFSGGLSVAPTLTLGYARLEPTAERVSGGLNGAHGEAAIEVRLAMIDALFLSLRPSIGGTVYGAALQEPWAGASVGLGLDF